MDIPETETPETSVRRYAALYTSSNYYLDEGSDLDNTEGCSAPWKYEAQPLCFLDVGPSKEEENWKEMNRRQQWDQKLETSSPRTDNEAQEVENLKPSEKERRTQWDDLPSDIIPGGRAT